MGPSTCETSPTFRSTARINPAGLTQARLRNT
jgi:hypothetical protein